MARSLIYKNAAIYEFVMRLLYGRHYSDRYKAIADLVPPGATVLDLCCGPATLYTRYLRQKNVHYTGFDCNENFIEKLRENGGDGSVVDLHDEHVELPESDYVIMQASLYHFLPEPAALLNRMIAAARNQVIIAEPIQNLTSSRNGFVAAMSRRLTDPGSRKQEDVDSHTARFTTESLENCISQHKDRQVMVRSIAGDREKLYVLNGASTSSSLTLEPTMSGSSSCCKKDG